MNTELTKQILTHVINGLFGLFQQKFILDEKMKIMLNDQLVQYDVFACESNIQDKSFKIIASNISSGGNNCNVFLVHLDGSPMYGGYCGDDANVIGCSVDGEQWMPCTTYLQATFLAAMEHLKDTYVSTHACKSVGKEFNCLINFTNFVDDLMVSGDDDEG